MAERGKHRAADREMAGCCKRGGGERGRDKREEGERKRDNGVKRS